MTQNGAVGAIYILSGIFLAASYIMSMCAIWFDVELRRLSCYKMILAVGSTDIAQVVIIGFAGGVASATGLDGTTYVYKFLGGLAASCWFGSTALALVLSFNRLVICWSKSMAIALFDGKKIYIWMALCYAYFFGILTMYLWPGCDFVYVSHLFHYGSNNTLTDMAARVNQLNNIITVSVMTVFHIGIFVLLKLKKMATSTQSLGKNERRAIAPAFIISFTMAFASIYYLVAEAMSIDEWTLVGAQLAWMYTAGVNGILFIVFNKTIKNQVRRFLNKHGTTIWPAMSKVSSANNRANTKADSQRHHTDAMIEIH